MSKKQKVYSLAFATVFLWASAFPLTKVAQAGFSSYGLAAMRCLVAAVILAVIGKITHIKRLPLKHFPYFIVSGACAFGVYMVLFNTGIETLTSATSSIIIALTPIMAAIATSFIYNEKINVIGWISIASAFGGVLVLLLWEGVLSINIGMVWTLGAAIVFCIYNVLSRHLGNIGYTSLEIVTYSMIFGAAMLVFFLPQGFAEMAVAQPKQILSVVYLAAFPSALAYFFWGNAMALAERTSEVTNFMFVTPLLSTIMGFIILKEVPNAGTFIGGAVIIISIVVFNLKGKKAMPTKEVPKVEEGTSVQ